MKLALGLLIAVCLGIFCRFFGIPLPGPPAIMGAVMAIAMATGYTATDYVLTRKSGAAATPPAGHAAVVSKTVGAADGQPKAEVAVAVTGSEEPALQSTR